ncbi:MAG: ORF6N domain-containing protein, partial [Bacilli bacterium]
MFQISKEEYINLKSQFGTSNINTYGGVRKLPYVFTEQGVAMLATILKTQVADIISMRIIDAFVYMRKYLSNENKNSVLVNHEERILKLEELFDKFSNKQNSIIYEGKIYDAYSILLDIFNESKEEIIIIDNYVNKELLDTLRNINKRIIIISKNYKEELIKKYKSQYQNIEFIN